MQLWSTRHTDTPGDKHPSLASVTRACVRHLSNLVDVAAALAKHHANLTSLDHHAGHAALIPFSAGPA